LGHWRWAVYWAVMVQHTQVTRDPEGGWTARAGDRGRCEGQNIPPLECVIETRWPGVQVDWNDTEPFIKASSTRPIRRQLPFLPSLCSFICSWEPYHL
jgi:hypothetical protein